MLMIWLRHEKPQRLGKDALVSTNKLKMSRGLLQVDGNMPGKFQWFHTWSGRHFKMSTWYRNVNCRAFYPVDCAGVKERLKCTWMVRSWMLRKKKKSRNSKVSQLKCIIYWNKTNSLTRLSCLRDEESLVEKLCNRAERAGAASPVLDVLFLPLSQSFNIYIFHI